MAAAQLSVGAYKEALIVLAVAGVIVPLMHRLRISPVFGFLGAGVLLGPFGLGSLFSHIPLLSAITIGERSDIAHVAEFGVVFLLFVIGLSLSFERLWTMRFLVFGFGLAQVVITSLIIVLLAPYGGLSPAAALVTGTALCLSSTAIVVEVLSKQKRLAKGAGRVTFAVLLFQDLAIVPIIFMVGVMGQQGEGSVAYGILIAFLQTTVVLGLIVGVGRLALRPLFRLVAATQSPELFMSATLFVVIATGIAVASVGLSMAVGAFVAGLLLAETEYRREVAVTIEPFKGLMLGVFFMSVGMGIDPAIIARQPTLIIGLALGLIVLKAALVLILGRFFKMPLHVSWESALLLAPGGEFAFVVLGMAVGLKVLPQGQADIILAIVSLSMITIPFLARLGQWGGDKLKNQPKNVGELMHFPQLENAPEASKTHHALVVGYGRVGELIGDMLRKQGITFIAADTSAHNVSEGRDKGFPVYFGDASRKEYLRQCGIMEAKVLIVTIGSSKAVNAVVSAAKELRPDVFVIARARDASHASYLYKMGVSVAVPETVEASLQLSEAALVRLGVPTGLAIAITHDKRDELTRDLQARYAKSQNPSPM
jgi:monovalent cation:H+ antiporter-2, CPA2 family